MSAEPRAAPAWVTHPYQNKPRPPSCLNNEAIASFTYEIRAVHITQQDT